MTTRGGDAGTGGDSRGTAGSAIEGSDGGGPDDAAGSAGIGAGVSSGGGSSSGGVAGVGEGGHPPLGGAGSELGGEGGTPACLPESPAEFCTRVGNNCGSVSGTDNCGTALVGIDCGTCTGFRKCGGAGQDNVCGALTDPALGGVATASSVMFIAENGSKAFDLDTTTKWYGGDNNTTGWLAYQFPGTTSHVVTSYSVTSANDVPTRDPSAWQLQGSNDGAAWSPIDQQSAQVFATRRQTNPYSCGNTTAYRWYRLLITANTGASSLQLAELALYGR